MSEIKKNVSICIDCGLEVSKNGSSDGLRYRCSYCEADYRDINKSTINRLNEKLLSFANRKNTIDKKIEVLNTEKNELEDYISDIKIAINTFTQMIELVKNSDYDKNMIIKMRNEIKETLKLK